MITKKERDRYLTSPGYCGIQGALAASGFSSAFHALQPVKWLELTAGSLVFAIALAFLWSSQKKYRNLLDDEEADS